MTVKRNIALNGIAQLGSRIVRIAEQLILVPFFLLAWGSEYYGEWLTLSIIPSVLAFSDLGFGTAASNSFVLYFSKGDFLSASKIFKTSISVISFIILLGVILSILVISIAWGTGLIEKSIIPTHDTIFAFVFLISSRLISFYSQLFEGLFRAVHKAATAVNYISLESVLRIIVGVITLFLGGGVVEYSVSQFIVALVFNIAFAYLAMRVIPQLPPAAFNKGMAINTLKTGIGFMLTPIWQSIYLQGSTFAVRIALGPHYVTIFNTVRTVCRSTNMLFSIVNGSIYPELQIAYGKGNFPLVRKIYTRAVIVVLISSFLGFGFLSLFGQKLYGWWTHNELTVPNAVWTIFMLGIVLNALWWTSGVVFRAINKPFKFSIYGFIASIISTFISFILAFPYGLMGATIGFLMMDVIMTILVVPQANREIGISFFTPLHKK